VTLTVPTAAPAANTFVPVGLGQAAAVKDVTGDATRGLVAYGLGSCVAICLFDPDTRVAGMAHVVLPGADPNQRPNPKFAGSALPALVEEMVSAGSGRDPRRFHARLVGGAQVLVIAGGGSLPRIGDKNAEAVQMALREAAIPVRAEQLGGGSGRTVWFDPREGGRVRVRTLKGSDCLI
jgi:chemotaxis protein CheD